MVFRQLLNLCCFFSPFPRQLRITVWSLCTKSVSYIKYPKACQQGESAEADFKAICCSFGSGRGCPLLSQRIHGQK